MVSEFGYTTASKVATKLRTSFDTTTSPSLADVEELISEQEALINQYAGRRFDQYPVSNEYHDHNGSAFITLENPLVSITTLEYTLDNGDTWVTVPNTDYIVEADYNRIERKIGGSTNTHKWPSVSGQRTVRITYNAGYSSPPARIAALALDMSVLAVIRTLLNAQSNEEGGDIKVGPIEIGESRLLNNPGYVRNLQDSVENRLNNLGGSRLWTSVSKSWSQG